MAYSWDLADMDMDFHGLSWTIIDLPEPELQGSSCGWWVVGAFGL